MKFFGQFRLTNPTRGEIFSTLTPVFLVHTVQNINLLMNKVNSLLLIVLVHLLHTYFSFSNKTLVQYAAQKKVTQVNE
jgi:hypothetical protein